MKRAPRGLPAQTLALGIGLAAMVAAPAFANEPAGSAQERHRTSTSTRTVNYVLTGTYARVGSFTGSLQVRYRLPSSMARFRLRMTFADGTTAQLTGRGRLRNGRARVAVRGSHRQELQIVVTQDTATVTLRASHRRIAVATATGTLDPTAPDPGWTAAQRAAWHRSDIGIVTLPYAWFMALERPTSQELLSGENSMAAFGFLADTSGAPNPDRLPVGFATKTDPVTQVKTVGLNCAACHTAEVEFNGKPLRIEGGRANVNLGSFRTTLGQAMGATAMDPAKFQRFATRVLGANHDPAAAAALGQHLGGLLQAGKAKSDAAKAFGLDTAVEEGFGRLDALTGGGNNLFGGLALSNLTIANGPVRLPHMWGITKLNWVQYNGSITQPLGRNLAAAMASGATPIVTTPTDPDLYKTGADIRVLHEAEKARAAIAAPKWPGFIEARQWRRGRRLYRQNCASCHDLGMTAPDAYGVRNYDVKVYGLSDIGTDPMAATLFSLRQVDTGSLNLGVISGGDALKTFTDGVMNRQFAELRLTPAQEREITGGRPNDYRAPLAYRARPLDGVWATGPFLHNGSVLNLYELLSPVAERKATFRLGPKQVFDAEKVGLKSLPDAPGTFLLDTSKIGNSNAGHEFRDGARGPGVIGRGLSARERMDLIEYLKSL
ncbi:MAG: c-type cytochrome [Planctomycetes bacterium]|nr:c-type cytochrome [Planctomycetota bacterium]